MKRRLFNKGSHVLIGGFVGYQVDRWPWLALIITLVFGGYQRTEQNYLGDTGYFEWKEFGVGVFIGWVIDRILERQV